MRSAILLLAAASVITSNAQEAKEIKYTSSADNSLQPAMFYAPSTNVSVPLIVALHSWSADYKQTAHAPIAKWCAQNGWAYIHPNFRGPSNKPEATGSRLVVGDIASAIEYARQTTKIDTSSVYLMGTSGGGYAALVMAGRRPELWAGVSAWVPISDLRAWYSQGRYTNDLVKSCGGAPGSTEAVDREYAERSPINYLKNAKGVVLHINAGVMDGHQGSVPISHSLLAFNEVAEPKDRLTSEQIRFFVEKAAVPSELRTDVVDPSYGKKKPLFRRTSGNATVTIFQGGHEGVPAAAIAWIQEVHGRRQEHSKADAGDSR
jgi:pimeloyl-ACP methyl ester carboxylesterase